MISSYTDYSIALWNGWRSGLNDSWLESITLLYPATARREYNSMPDSGHPRLWSNRTHTQTRSSRAHAPRPNTVNTHTHQQRHADTHLTGGVTHSVALSACIKRIDGWRAPSKAWQLPCASWWTVIVSLWRWPMRQTHLQTSFNKNRFSCM